MASLRISSYLVTLVSNSSGLLFVLLLVLGRLGVPVGAASIVPHRERLANPCSGSKSLVIETLGLASTERVSDDRLTEEFQQLAHKTDRLRKRVKELKQLYVSERFKRSDVENNLDEAGFSVEGMPSTQSATVSSIGRAQVVPTVHQAFDDLARVSVFVDQARIGEALAEEHAIFEEHFAVIEDHHEDGLYLILCSLHRVSLSLGEPISADMYRDILNLKVKTVDNKAWRHARDYVVLRDFEKILGRLEMHFAALKQLHAS